MNRPLIRLVFRLVIRVALAIGLCGAVILSVVMLSRPATAATTLPERPSAPQLAEATVAPTVRAVGVFGSGNQATLAFQMAGRIKDIPIKETARVKAGDLLIRLDTSTLDIQVAQAQAALDGAQAKLDQLKNPTAADISAAQAGVAAAEAAMAQLKSPSTNDLMMAKADIDKAKAAVSTAQAAYDRIGGMSNPFIAMTPQSLALQAATLDYQKAQAAYNARVSPTDSQLKQVQATVEQSHDLLARLMSPSPNDIKTAQAVVAQAQSALDLAKQNTANAQITAPFDGTVIQINPHVGELVAPNAPVIALADLSQMQVIAGVDENSYGQIKLGQKATITADALPGQTLTGRVTKIGVLASSASGVIRIPVTIDVDPTDAPAVPGLSANVEISIGQ